MNKRYNRRSIRLKGYDYSQAGLYFVTICCKNREHFFGYISQQTMYLNDAGKMIASEWLKLPARFPDIHLHEFVIMPNHFHAIIELVGATLVVAQNAKQVAQNAEKTIQNKKRDTQNPEQDNQNPEIKKGNTNRQGQGQPQGLPQRIPPTKKTLGDIIGAFESITTVAYIRGVKAHHWKRFDKKLWQRNYWEHIIRNERAFNNISNYIKNNPAKWKDDMFH